MFADLDNDGWKDIYIANGTRREINNQDFFKKIEKKGVAAEKTLEKTLEMPSEKIANYVLRNNGKKGVFNTRVMKVFLDPAIPIVAYITALEAIVTDLFGFTPIQYLDDKTADSSIIICFCGNFGILLLNPSWLSIDGGRTALDVLEKMINVTMMRGM